MTACHDPYRELELYLEKAQEEIGKAFDELLQHDENSSSSSSNTWNNSDPLLPPPPAFRSPSSQDICSRISDWKLQLEHGGPPPTMNRVCYDGNVMDLHHTLPGYPNKSRPPYHLQKSLSSPARESFFSKIGANIVTTNGTERTVRNGNVTYSTCTKRMLKQLRPSFSFPEGSMEAVLRKTVLAKGSKSNCDSEANENSVPPNSPAFGDINTNSIQHSNPLSQDVRTQRLRQRSFSETSPPRLRSVVVDEPYHTFPRPPSGDVNLLAIWADNLVLEIDKSMSGELNNSIGSYSPSSDYSLSPMKRDDENNYDSTLENHSVKNKVLETGFNSSKHVLALSNINGHHTTMMCNYSKLVSQSPDSGIEQVNCETPEACEDVVDFIYESKKYKRKGISSTLIIKKDVLQSDKEFDVDDCITPPPPEFEDKEPEVKILNQTAVQNQKPTFPADVQGTKPKSNIKSLGKKDAETQVNQKQVLKAANSVTLTHDNTVLLENKTKEIHRRARVIPMVSMELEDCATLTTTCIVGEAPWKGAVLNGFQDHLYFDGTNAVVSQLPEGNSVCGKSTEQEYSRKTSRSSSSIPSDDYLSENEDDVFEDDNDSPKGYAGRNQYRNEGNINYISSLPKQANRVKAVERYSSSLPRDAGRIPPAVKNGMHAPQRSSSSSAVSSISQVSMDELAAFMWKVKKSTYHPPPRVDVCIYAQDDCDDEEDSNRDAVTQTTPLPLSRSSSFTWVTECDCSDWDSSNLRSGSEDSLLLSCSNGTPEKKACCSSTSPSVTSDEDPGNLPQGSGCSSLYLSACSEASESSNSHSSPEEPDCKAPRGDHGSRSSEDLKQEVGSQISKYHILVESCTSSSGGITLTDISEENPKSETLSIDSAESSPSDNAIAEQSASFPSTLKSSNKNRFPDDQSHRIQPIEANVLIINELNMKSMSAPILRHKRHTAPKKLTTSSTESSLPTGSRSRDHTSSQNEPTAPPRAHSAKELNELQAIEACSWLRAAGFPQYAQMYEDNLFPIDICTVQKDHAFLHPDSIQSLFRRLNTLNRCARMKFVDNVPRKSLHLDESDDEEQCALSENWQFQRTSRRWSRVPSPTQEDTDCNTCVHDRPPSPKPCRYAPSSPFRKYLSPEEAYCSSHDSVFIEEQHSSPDSIRRSAIRNDEQYHPVSALREGGGGGGSPGSSSGSGTLSLGSEDISEKTDVHQRNLHRSGSDRIKEGAKALLRRMESLKGRRKKKVRDGTNIENIRDIVMSTSVNSGTDGSSCSSLTPSPQLTRRCRIRGVSPRDMSDCSQGGTPQSKQRKKGWGTLCKGETEASAHSDSECPVLLVSELWKDANCNETKLIEHYVTSQASVRITNSSPTDQDWPTNDHNVKTSAQDQNPCSEQLQQNLQQKKNWLHPNCSQHQEDHGQNNRASHYDNFPAPLVVFNNACVEDLEKDHDELGTTESTCQPASDQSLREGQDEGEIIIINNERRDSGVGSSLTRGSYNQAPWHCFPRHSSPTAGKLCCKGTPVTNLNAPQILVLRKLSLLKLTTLMEKFSPSSRTGWSWAVPKFIRRIRTPDYKDKVVFGVPLLLVLQRTGQPLPVSIQAAIHYLRKTALDSTGLFRKSGVRSRIQKLRNLNESNPDKINYEDQQAYDVADMLKQYFRELPEALLTTKLSETFISIYQYIPEELRLEAIQAAILLMPDENREVLQSLLSFLLEVCQHSGENQMTATNLAVCFAPSLFHLSTPRSASASPRRRKTVGVPDLRELNENRAAYECLSSMVVNYKQLFSISEELFSQSRMTCMDNCEPSTLEELSTVVNRDAYGWRPYIESCIQSMLKESKDKYKGWVSVSQSDSVDLAYKKVGDGHPLRLWKVSTEVEAPPIELLNRLLRERHLWDTSFLKWRVVNRLDKQTELFQYVSSSLPPHPACDYSIIRSWKTDLPKGACVLIEASVDHPEARLMVDGIRAIVLASRFLIEPCGSGKSRITHISRVDTRGRSPEWYNRAYGHICTLQLTKLRDSFSHTRTEGPETKV